MLLHWILFFLHASTQAKSDFVELFHKHSKTFNVKKVAVV